MNCKYTSPIRKAAIQSSLVLSLFITGCTQQAPTQSPTTPKPGAINEQQAIPIPKPEEETVVLLHGTFNEDKK